MRDSLVGEGRLFEPDVLLPSQYFDRLRRALPQGPEYSLVIAVLQDAVECFQKHYFATDAPGRELFEDARAWIESDDRQWPFSFENICAVLNLNAEYLRTGLRAWAAREETRRDRKVVPLKVPAPPVTDSPEHPEPAAAKAS